MPSARKQVLPALDSSGLDILMVDVDANPDLAAKLIDPKDRGIPRFVRLGEKNSAGDVQPLDWLIGFHDLAAIERWIALPQPARKLQSHPRQNNV